MSGIEGTQAITALALSKSRKWLAVAEKHEKAPIISIYDTTTLKRRKYLVAVSQQELSKLEEIISMAFSPTQEKFLITLTNEPGQQVILWMWDKGKVCGHQPLSNNTANVLGTQVSFSSTDDKKVLVTGPSTYRIY